MCTRPDYRSVSTSARAFARSCFALASCFCVLLLALVCTPARFAASRRPRQLSVPSVAHVDIQVHLEDAKCVSELKRVIRQTLRRTARTWAPLPLPVDRIVVGATFPASGKVDLYTGLPHAAPSAIYSNARPFVVVSLGLRDGDRELDTSEVAGALSAQIQAVIDDQYAQRTTLSAIPRPAAPSTMSSSAASPLRSGGSSIRPRPSTVEPPPLSAPNSEAVVRTEAEPTFPSMREYIATKQQSQPLEVTGSSTNGTHL
jgi:hypothetical protein